MSGNVGSVISASSMVENVGVAAGTASPALTVQQLFPLPVFVASILSSGCRPMSCNVGSVISELRMSANVVQCVGSVISELSMVENVGMAVEIVFVVVIFQSEVIFQSVFGFPAAKLDFW